MIPLKLIKITFKRKYRLLKRIRRRIFIDDIAIKVTEVIVTEMALNDDDCECPDCQQLRIKEEILAQRN